MNAEPKKCPCCGQLIPPKLRLGPVKRHIYRELLMQPCSAQWLREHIWSDGKSHANIYAHIMQLKRSLEPYGLTIKAEWRGAYRISELPHAHRRTA